MNIYLASSWRNTNQPAVLAELRQLGHDVYDFRNPAPGDQGFAWRQITDDKIDSASKLRSVLGHPIAQRGFLLDFSAMRRADACVLLLPCGNSAHLEAGWFTGRGLPLAVLAPEVREPELMYKLSDDVALPVQDPSDRGTPIFATVAEVDAFLRLWWADQLPW